MSAAEQFFFNSQGVRFRATKLVALKQLNLYRRIAPLLPPMLPLLAELLKSLPAEEASAEETAPCLTMQKVGSVLGNLDSLLPLAVPLMEAFAGLSDADAEYILNMCLNTVEREQQDVWHPIWINNRTMFRTELSDITQLLPVVFHVVKGNLANFTGALFTNPSSGAKTTPA